MTAHPADLSTTRTRGLHRESLRDSHGNGSRSLQTLQAQFVTVTSIMLGPAPLNEGVARDDAMGLPVNDCRQIRSVLPRAGSAIVRRAACPAIRCRCVRA